MKNQESNDRFNALWPAFQFFNPFFPTGGETWAQFWHNQEKILECMEDFTDGWFERRHAGTTKAYEAARRASETESIVDVAREIQTWATGSMQRIAEDCQACHRHLMTVYELAAPATAQPAEAARPEKPGDSEKLKRSIAIPAQAA